MELRNDPQLEEEGISAREFEERRGKHVTFEEGPPGQIELGDHLLKGEGNFAKE